ncbi:MAG TPA: ABC transporter permease, partial [Allosphingosinicella sp.]|nr:ABC transporter permease [Allosphingosinicella sp.]
MFRHYLLMGVRTLARSRAYSFSNMFGLAAGFASCLLILLFVRYELSFDRWLPHADRTYQVQLSLDDPDSGAVHLQMAPYPAAAALARDFPQIEATAGSFTARPVILRDGVATLPERDALMADANFFEVVAIPLVSGNPRTALSPANSVVLSRSEARRYFGERDPVGQVMTILHRGQRRDVRVTGMFEDLPANSHMRFPMVFRLNPSDYADEPGLLADWDNISGYVYARLRPGADPEAVAAGLPAWVRRHVPVAAGAPRPEDGQTFHLTRVTDVHLGRSQTASMTPGSDSKTIATFAGVALMILAVACFNFINLSTARAARRAREVGVRKVLGARRRQLVAQFVTESMMIVGAAMLVALAAVELAAPMLGNLVDADLGFDYFGSDGLWLSIVGLVGGVGLLATIYPALV